MPAPVAGLRALDTTLADLGGENWTNGMYVVTARRTIWDDDLKYLTGPGWLIWERQSAPLPRRKRGCSDRTRPGSQRLRRLTRRCGRTASVGSPRHGTGILDRTTIPGATPAPKS